MQKQYTKQEKIEGILKRSLTDFEGEIVDDVIESVSEDIASYTGREWNSIGFKGTIEEEVRIFDGDGGNDLYIDDFSEITQIELLDSQGSVYSTIDDVEDYILSPSNKPVKESVYLRGHRYPIGEGRVKVTGKFTSGPVPADVSLVAAQLVAKFFTDTSLPAGLKKESIEGYTREFSSTMESDAQTQSIMMRLDKYKKISL